MSYRRYARGQALIEAAATILVFCTLAFGVVEFGRVLLVANALANAAREGARLASVTPSLIVNDPRVKTRVLQSLLPVGITSAAVFTLPGTLPDKLVRVRVRVPYRALLGAFFPGVDGRSLEGVAMMRYEI